MSMESMEDLRKRALACLLQAQDLIGKIMEDPVFKEGSPPEATLWYLHDAIGMLSTDEEAEAIFADADQDEQTNHPTLRIVKG